MHMSSHNGIGVAELSNEDFRDPNQLEDAFQGLMRDLPKRRLVVDLSKVESIMSLGVAVLVAAQGLALIHKTKIAFAGTLLVFFGYHAHAGIGIGLNVDESIDVFAGDSLDGTHSGSGLCYTLTCWPMMS